MEKNIFKLNNQIYSNNNNILNERLIDLNQLMNVSKDNLIIKLLTSTINKINYIINENRKNMQFVINDLSLLYHKINMKIDKLNINKKEIKYDDGKYIGHIVNGLKEGKGIRFWNDGDRYEGNWRNDKQKGRGIYYFNNGPFKGDRYEGEWKNGKQEGKGIYFYNNGDRFEGEFRNDKQEGKGIYYFHNGDRRMGDFYNDKEIGKHVRLTRNGDVKIENY